MLINYDLGTGRDEIIFKISHDEENDELIAEIKKCDVNYMDKTGRSYLYYAALHHKVKLVEVLLERGADPNIIDDRGQTPLLCALGRKNSNNPKILELFLKAGVDLNNITNGKTLKEEIYEFQIEEYNAIINEWCS